MSVYNESDRFDLDYEADVVEEVTEEGAVYWTKEYEVVSKAEGTVYRLVRGLPLEHATPASVSCIA